MARDNRSFLEVLAGKPAPRPPKPRTLDEIIDTLDRVTNGLIGETVVTGVRGMENARAPRA